MNWVPNQAPMSDMAPRLALMSDPDRRMPRRISGEVERRSMATKSASSAAVPMSEPMVRPAPQPTSGASTRVKTSRSMATVTLTAPPMMPMAVSTP